MLCWIARSPAKRWRSCPPQEFRSQSITQVIAQCRSCRSMRRPLIKLNISPFVSAINFVFVRHKLLCKQLHSSPWEVQTADDTLQWHRRSILSSLKSEFTADQDSTAQGQMAWSLDACPIILASICVRKVGTLSSFPPLPTLNVTQRDVSRMPSGF